MCSGPAAAVTSIFSGETGLRFARHFKDAGADVTLLMGPGRAKFEKEDWTEMNVRQFFYYDDLAELLEEELDNIDGDRVQFVARPGISSRPR